MLESGWLLLSKEAKDADDSIRTFTGELSFLDAMPAGDDAELSEEGKGLLAEEVWVA